jgi:hypothetical protein
LKLSLPRALIVAFMALAAPLGVSPALAAPTCQDRNGDTIRCGTQGAMPVGWTLPPEERLEKERLHPPTYPSINTLLELACVLGVFFTLLALMPDFEGDWDKQEGDDKKRR